MNLRLSATSSFYPIQTQQSLKFIFYLSKAFTELWTMNSAYDGDKTYWEFIIHIASSQEKTHSYKFFSTF